jgi:hypothetical protein
MVHLTDDMSRLCDEIRDLHSDHAAFLNGLKVTVAGIGSDVSQMKKGFQQSRAEMAEKTKDDLMAFVSGIRSSVSDLQSDASRMQEGFRSSYKEMARAGRSERGNFVVDLKNTVSSLRQEVVSDLTAIRRMWCGLVPIQPKAKPERPEETSEEITTDDLKKIPGIGPGVQKRLNQAGIYTLAQLAQSSHEQVRKAMGKLAELADTYDWIGEARKMA